MLVQKLETWFCLAQNLWFSPTWTGWNITSLSFSLERQNGVSCGEDPSTYAGCPVDGLLSCLSQSPERTQDGTAICRPWEEEWKFVLTHIWALWVSSVYHNRENNLYSSVEQRKQLKTLTQLFSGDITDCVMYPKFNLCRSLQKNWL